MSTTKHTTIDQLKKLALRTKNEIGLVDAKVANLTTKVNDLVTAGTRNVYDSYGVSADNVTTSGQMTFRCDTTPTIDLSVFIIRLEVGTYE